MPGSTAIFLQPYRLSFSLSSTIFSFFFQGGEGGVFLVGIGVGVGGEDVAC